MAVTTTAAAPPPGQAPQAGEAPESNRSDALRTMVARFAGLLAVAIVTLALSSTLSALSGTALRLPPQWGVSVQAAMVTLGVSVFAFARHLNTLRRAKCIFRAQSRAAARAAGSGEDVEAARTEAQTRMEMICKVRSRYVTLGCLLMVLGSIFFYQWMHRQCEWRFTPPSEDGQWYWAEWGPDDGAQWECAEGEHPNDCADRRELLLEEVDKRLPRFIVRESNSLYVPLVLPEDLKSRIALAADPTPYLGEFATVQWSDLSDDAKFQLGKAALLHDPQTLIEKYIMECPDFERHMERTQLWFYLLHAFVVTCVSLAAGFAFAPEQAIKNLLEDAADLFPT